jgi:outer membrane protein assembly factor BamB
MTKRRFFGIRNGLVGHSVVLHLSILLFILVFIPSVPAQDMMYRYDAGHTGDYSPVAGVTGTYVSLLWSKTTENAGWVLSIPIVSHGTIYAPGIDGQLYSLNATTGVQQWNSSIVIYSSPAIADNIVYTGDIYGNVYALDAVSGKKIWAYSTGGSIHTSPTIANDTLYITSTAEKRTDISNVTLYALNSMTGKKIWSFMAGGESDLSPAVEDDTVFMGCDDRTLFALSTKSGGLLWSATIDGAAGTSPLVKNGTIYIGSKSGTVYAFNATTGARLWRFTTDGGLSSEPALSSGILYVNSNSLYALNATSGALMWNSSSTGRSAALIVANGTVYSGGGDVVALNASTGVPLWEWNFPASWGGGTNLALVTENGVLYGSLLNVQLNPEGGNARNTIYALDLNAGASGIPISALTPAPTTTTSKTIAPAKAPSPSTGIPLAVPGIALLAAVVLVFGFQRRKRHE